MITTNTIQFAVEVRPDKFSSCALLYEGEGWELVERQIINDIASHVDVTIGGEQKSLLEWREQFEEDDDE